MARQRLALLLVPYVLVSSFLGLTGRFVFALGDAFAFFAGIWRSSLAADAVFIAGSVGAGLLAWWLARRRATLSILAAFAANAIVYVVSFAVLVAETSIGSELAGMFAFFIPAGIVGLAFAAVSPAIARRMLDAEPPAEDATPSAR